MVRGVFGNLEKWDGGVSEAFPESEGMCLVLTISSGVRKLQGEQKGLQRTSLLTRSVSSFCYEDDAAMPCAVCKIRAHRWESSNWSHLFGGRGIHIQSAGSSRDAIQPMLY